jgi:hypothetical protein
LPAATGAGPPDHNRQAREAIYRYRLDFQLPPARRDIIADEYYRVGMTLSAAFDHVQEQLTIVRQFETSFGERYHIRCFHST